MKPAAHALGGDLQQPQAIVALLGLLLMRERGTLLAQPPVEDVDALVVGNVPPRFLQHAPHLHFDQRGVRDVIGAGRGAVSEAMVQKLGIAHGREGSAAPLQLYDRRRYCSFRRNSQVA